MIDSLRVKSVGTPPKKDTFIIRQNIAIQIPKACKFCDFFHIYFNQLTKLRNLFSGLFVIHSEREVICMELDYGALFNIFLDAFLNVYITIFTAVMDIVSPDFTLIVGMGVLASILFRSIKAFFSGAALGIAISFVFGPLSSNLIF